MDELKIALTLLNLLENVKLGKIKEWYVKRQDIIEIKKRAQILFIDDQKFDLIDRIKEDGWTVDYLPDLASFTDPKVLRSHVIFVDYKGVGKFLADKNEGLGLIRGLKCHFPKKQVILYSAHGQFGISDELEHQKYADDLIPKESEPFVYTEKIEKHARKAIFA